MDKQWETMIKVKKTTRNKLTELKIHPRQSYDEVINFLVESYTKMKGGEKK